MNKTVCRDAYAKVNLTLDVLGRREDGYHLVDMIMQSVSLCDTVTVSVSGPDECGIHDASREAASVTSTAAPFPVSMEMIDERKSICIPEHARIRRLSPIPCDEKNLMVKAALAMIEAYGISGHISMKLVKRIPSEAGLAGGSTDAAAVLLALNEACGLNRPAEELMQLGGKLGADIPFCILGHTARAEGIGEKLTPLRSLAESGLYLLLVKPEAGGSTPKIYAAYDAVEEELGEGIIHPDTAAAAAAIEAGDIGRLMTAVGNVLEYPVCRTVPMLYHDEPSDLIHILRRELTDLGAEVSCMSGSGSTVYGIFRSPEAVSLAKQALSEKAEEFRILDLIEAVPV